MNSNESAKQSATKTTKKNKAKFLILGSLLLSLSLFFSFLAIPNRSLTASADEPNLLVEVGPDPDVGGGGGGTIVVGATQSASFSDKFAYYPKNVDNWGTYSTITALTRAMQNDRYGYVINELDNSYLSISNIFEYSDGSSDLRHIFDNSISYYSHNFNPSNFFSHILNSSDRYFLVQIVSFDGVELSTDNLRVAGFAVYSFSSSILSVVTYHPFVLRYIGYSDTFVDNQYDEVIGIDVINPSISGTDIGFLYNLGQYLYYSSNKVDDILNLKIGNTNFLALLFGGSFGIYALIVIAKFIV